MPVVPFSSQGQAPAPKPPDNTYLMMAAAQMHKEGRLVKDQDILKGIPETVRGGKPTEPSKEPPRQYRGPTGKPTMMT